MDLNAEIQARIAKAQYHLNELWRMKQRMEEEGYAPDNKKFNFMRTLGYYHANSWEVYASLLPENTYYLGPDDLICYN